MKSTVVLFVTLAASALAVATAGAEDLKLPKEVTPALRAACEPDVRRLCTVKDPTIAKVKSCVRRNFTRLGLGCQMKLASAGFGR
ncbi:MAG: hypothetical protein KJ622_09245 [Alphaproteobacteria bacterium]|nr:hypothetical protein [Alphaproteobacteria bacterium]